MRGMRRSASCRADSSQALSNQTQRDVLWAAASSSCAVAPLQ
jgi:hypothetical protein